MRLVSIPVQRDTADRPASKLSRKPSRVSPSGVLIAMPVTAIRLSLDKEYLHDAERADRLTVQDLSGANGAIVIRTYNGCDDVQPLAGADLMQENRVVNSDGPDIAG